MQRKLPGAEAREGFPPEHAVRPLGLEGMQRGEAGKGSLLLLLHGAAPGPTPTFSRVYVARSMISGKCSSYSRMTSFSINITHYERNANQNHNEISRHTSRNGHHQKVYKQ